MIGSEAMIDIYPDFYREFRCIANRCEDSCCKDWDIDIDSETEAFYRTVKGPLGDKIRALLETDEYGERVFRTGYGRCPFWNEDMLCDIYIGIGEEHLSHTCANFPRVHIDYFDFCEHLLSFACPEAARFMLSAGEDAYADFGGEAELSTCTDSEDSEDYMSFLLRARDMTVNYLLPEDRPFAFRLADCLDFNDKVQSVLDGEEPVPLELDFPPCPDYGFIFEMHRDFEIMSETWRDALSDTAAKAGKLPISEDFDRDFKKFALYYIYRYYLEAVNSGDVLYALKRIVCAYLVTGKMDAFLASEGYPLSRMRILQRYSKEVEHSYDNTEKLNATFDADERFSVQKLISLLQTLKKETDTV